jgi:hypothetical protein
LPFDLLLDFLRILREILGGLGRIAGIFCSITGESGNVASRVWIDPAAEQSGAHPGDSKPRERTRVRVKDHPN